MRIERRLIGPVGREGHRNNLRPRAEMVRLAVHREDPLARPGVQFLPALADHRHFATKQQPGLQMRPQPLRILGPTQRLKLGFPVVRARRLAVISPQQLGAESAPIDQTHPAGRT